MFQTYANKWQIQERPATVITMSSQMEFFIVRGLKGDDLASTKDLKNIMNVMYLCADSSSGAYGGVEDL